MNKNVYNYVPEVPVPEGEVLSCSFYSSQEFNEETSKFITFYVVDVVAKNKGLISYTFEEQIFAIQFYDLVVKYMEKM